MNDISIKINELLQLYESNKTIPIDILNSTTFTISDLSQTGASFVLPLINGNQSLIIAIVQPLTGIYKLIAAFDHRISEGMYVSKFLDELSERVKSHFYADRVLNITCSLCGKSLSKASLGSLNILFKCTLSSGQDGHLCRECFNGW